MKNPNFIVKVPEPCHEDWNKMQPDEKGKFCGSCSKSVVDFTNKTDEEIKNILLENKSQKVCGHFKSSQLNRPLNYVINPRQLPRNMSLTKAFAIALFFVFGSMLFSCTNQKNEDVNVLGGMEATEEVYLTGAPIPQNVPNEDFKQNDTTTYDLPETEVTTYADPLIDGEYSITGGVGSYYTETENNNTIAENDTLFKEDNLYGTLGFTEIEIIHGDSTINDSIVQRNNGVQIGDNVITKQTDLSVYPNPSTGEFTIKYDVLKRADIKIDVFDMKGALVKPVVNQSSQYEGKYQIPVNLNEMPPGVYFVNLTNGEKRFTEKVVISK